MELAHTKTVSIVYAAGLSAVSAAQQLKIVKSTTRATLVGAHMAGESKKAARYKLGGQARLLVDVRIVGTVAKSKLRLYVTSGRGRITLWRGTPGSSAPRLRLASALVRHGYVTIHLTRALHPGRVRFVVIASKHIVVTGTGAHKPKMKVG